MSDLNLARLRERVSAVNRLTVSYVELSALLDLVDRMGEALKLFVGAIEASERLREGVGDSPAYLVVATVRREDSEKAAAALTAYQRAKGAR